MMRALLIAFGSMAAVAFVIGSYLTSLPDRQSEAYRDGLESGIGTLHECDKIAEQQVADDDRDNWRAGCYVTADS